MELRTYEVQMRQESGWTRIGEPTTNKRDAMNACVERARAVGGDWRVFATDGEVMMEVSGVRHSELEEAADVITEAVAAARFVADCAIDQGEIDNGRAVETVPKDALEALRKALVRVRVVPL